MSAEINDGGPAFPVALPVLTEPSVLMEASVGITVRDWLAAHATEEDIEEHRKHRTCPLTGSAYSCRTREAAKYAYADEMIRTRKGGTNGN
jgi:hypothetical protein